MEYGANVVSGVCYEKFTIDDIESPIPIDTSAEEWIKEIEENVRKNKILKTAFYQQKARKIQ